MEKIVLRLIYLLRALLDFPNLWSDNWNDYKPLHDEALQLLTNELPNLLEWCKSDYIESNKIPPELDDLRALLGQIISKGHYTINAFIDTEKELLEDIASRPYLWQIADVSKQWQYYISKYFKLTTNIEPLQETPTPTEQVNNEQIADGQNISQKPQPIPKELETPEAKEYFDKAIKLGLMDANYKWLKGLQMLACFSRDMSLKLDLGKGVNSDGSPRISWKPFETLFKIGHGKLRNNYNDIQKTGKQPRDAYLIDKVFE